MQFLHFRSRTLHCLYPLDLLHLGGITSQDVYPVVPSAILLLSVNASFSGAITAGDAERVETSFDALMNSDPSSIARIHSSLKKQWPGFRKASDALRTLPSGAPSSEITRAFKHFNAEYLSASRLSWIAIALYPPLLERALRRVLLASNVPLEQHGVYLAAFSKPSSPTFSSREGASLRRILKLARGHGIRWPLAQLTADKLATLAPAVHAAITRHLRMFKWLPVDYTGTPWEYADILDRLQALESSNRESSGPPLDGDSYELTARMMAAALPPATRSIKRFGRDLAALQDLRKEYFSYAHYCVNALLAELARRYNRSPRDLHYCTADELACLDLPGTSVIRERQRCWAARCTSRGSSILVGEAAALLRDELEESFDPSSTELHGTPASSGKATGRSRVLLTPEEAGTLLAGEILVTKMTTPAFVTAMARAAAVVTDEGGITSHAAIICRELHIPCVVGVRSATTALRSSPYITVDGDLGSIQIVTAPEESVNSTLLPIKAALVSNADMGRSRSTSGGPLVTRLSSRPARWPYLCGNKTSNLAVLSTKLPVPPGFCVTTTAFKQFVSSGTLRRDLLDAVASCDVNYPKSYDVAAAQIASLIEAAPLPSKLELALLRAFRYLGPPVAVRSSSSSEDSQSHSGAGQHDTILNVVTERHFLVALKQCWSSLYSSRAIAYRNATGQSQTDVSMAVLVQRMVDADFSGVVFTRSPVGSPDELLIECVRGLGETLVSGMVTPERFVLTRDTLKVIRHQSSRQRLAVKANPSGGTAQHHFRTKSRRSPSASLIREVAAMSLIAERLSGVPQDVEWAAEGAAPFLLQARPITTSK
jgi:phosphohistidine swiveling domain-containing protein